MLRGVSRHSLAGMLLLLVGVGCSKGPPYSLTGTAKLPSCSEGPAGDLTGMWFDGGEVTILTDGCRGSSAGQVFASCSLGWAFTQEGGDVSILVDEEYELKARLCGNELHFEGGWWLPVEDPPFGCTYEEDSAAEVGIQSEGATLRLSEDMNELTGVLVVEEKCTAEYDITLQRPPS